MFVGVERLFAWIWLATCACPAPAGSTADGRARLVFVHQPLGDPRPLNALLDEFRRAHPDLSLSTELLPNEADVAHQYFLTALEGAASSLDVFVADIVWIAEFARAGWIADLSDAFSPEELRRDFLPGPVDAVTLDGRVFAVPWYVDAGILYWRTDLVPRAPRTYAELEAFAAAAQARDPSLVGYVWQGRQYEGLVCDVYEAIWGHGGTSFSGGRLALDQPPARDALAYLRGLIVRGRSPAWVISAAEEEARRAFQSGRAVFMRNWPYAWVEAQAPGSPIRGRVDFAPLPTADGAAGAGALGGWQLAVSSRLAPGRRKAAIALVRFLSSPRAEKVLAEAYGRNPARRSVYEDPELRAKEPFIVSLLPIVERARPRPVTPYYPMLSDVLQGEFSAAVSGIRTPAEALRRAQAQSDRIMGQATP
jgi:multiple sugar transport system substrate-binding protein